MELTDLKHFAHVARAGSFTAGAKRSHVTPPAVSKAVRKLEDELGVDLFVRTTRRVSLTDAGRELLLRCDRIFGELDELRAELDARTGRIEGDLRIGAMEVFSIELLPRALARLVGEHPAVRPFTHEADPLRMERWIRDGRVEVGFTIGGSRSGDLEYEELGRSKGALVCGKTHPLHGQKRIRKAQLTEYPSVVPRFMGQEDAPSLDQFPEGWARREVGATIELLQMGVQLCIEGTYLGYFPEVSVRGPLADGRLHRLGGVGGAEPFVLWAVSRKGAPRRPMVAALLGEVRAAVRRVSG